MNNADLIKQRIEASIAVKKDLLANTGLLNTIDAAAEELIKTYRNKGKVLFCGNGGSAADAQHLAAELSGRFYTDREPLYAEALHVNTSYITAVANDYSFDEIFARAVRAQGVKGDVLVALSTSGNSENIVRAVQEANKLGLITVGLTGENGGKLKDLCKYLVNIPSTDTPRIQESHILVGHILCELVERKMF
jgi:D-sedoheptulose 7-phosphate isomerase